MKQQELLNIQNNVEETNPHKQNSIWDREQLKNTPFWVVGNPEIGYKITMGKYSIIDGEPIQAKDLLSAILIAEGYLQEHLWDVVLSIALIAYTDIKYRHEGQNDTNK